MLYRGLLLLPLCLILVAGTAQSGDKGKQEQDKLEGIWTVIEIKGGKMKHDEKNMKATFKGDKVTLKDGDKTMEAKYTVDPSKKPHTMDLIVEKEGKKMTMLSIYELDGDSLKVCHFEGEKASKERPKAFAADDDTVTAKLKREKK